jgi:hypothetical protein
MISNMIDKMFNGMGKKKPTIVDLIRRNNIKFLSPRSDEFIPKVRRKSLTEAVVTSRNDALRSSTDIYYHPMFVSGSVITPIMLEAILSNAHQMPSLINIFNAFVGVRYPSDMENDKCLGLERSRLCCVTIPTEFIGRPFGDIFKTFAEILGVVPMGILRNHTLEGNPLPYVITNPMWSWLVQETDYLYVLAPPSVLE